MFFYDAFFDMFLSIKNKRYNHRNRIEDYKAQDIFKRNIFYNTNYK